MTAGHPPAAEGARLDLDVHAGNTADDDVYVHAAVAVVAAAVVLPDLSASGYRQSRFLTALPGFAPGMVWAQHERKGSRAQQRGSVWCSSCRTASCWDHGA